MDMVTLAAAKKYTQETAEGMGAIKGDPGEDGFSPTVEIADIPGGHRVTVTDADGAQSFDVMNGSGTPVSVLTKAEYDALTDAEKQADVMYAITDDASGGGGGSSGGEVYSTEETRIGTWIDGKPLYSRVVVGTTPSTSGEHEILDFPDAKFAFAYGNISNANGGTYCVPNNSLNLGISNSKLVVYFDAKAFASQNFQVSISYTKTTD